MTRIAIKIQKDLLNDFDEFLKKKGFTSRSKGMHEAMNEYIKRHK